jgi:hypothetical protein
VTGDIVPILGDVCELCHERVDYCSCLRCMDCEELFLDSEEWQPGDHGPTCVRCLGSVADHRHE